MLKNSSPIDRSNNRKEKLSSSIKKELARLVERKESKFLDIAFVGALVSLTGITFKNYRNFKVFVSVLEKDLQPKIVALLNKSAPKLAFEVSQALELRTVPKITFQADQSFEEANRVLNIISSLKN